MWNMDTDDRPKTRAAAAMRNLRGAWLLVALAAVAAGCSDAAVDQAKKKTTAAIDAAKAGADTAIDATKQAGAQAMDATKDAAAATKGPAKEIAGEIADKGKELASGASAAVTDAWVTAKVKAKLADEKSLNGSDLRVETKDHVVTLMGSVPSAAAKARALEIAAGTERVTRVLDRLVVAARDR